MVDKADLKSSAQFGRVGSSPTHGTNTKNSIRHSTSTNMIVRVKRANLGDIALYSFKI